LDAVSAFYGTNITEGEIQYMLNYSFSIIYCFLICTFFLAGPQKSLGKGFHCA